MIEKTPPRVPTLTLEQRERNARTELIRKKEFELGRRVSFPDKSASDGRGVFLWVTDEGLMIIGPLHSKLEDYLHQEGDRLIPDMEKLSKLPSYEPKDVELIAGSLIFTKKR